MFSFNPYKYDFWPIYNCIQKAYPIGIDIDSVLFKNYPGQFELERQIVDNIHDRKNYKDRWTSFEKVIAKKTKSQLIGTTYGQEPSFSAFLNLNESKSDSTIISSELHFFVSVAGPFYNVLGINRSITSIEDKNISSVQFIVLSPYGQFSTAFLKTCYLIEERFKGYRFVPFFLCQQKMAGLPNRFSSATSNTVFSALFSSQILTGATSIGDEYFKIEQWAKSDPTNEGDWTSHAPINK